MRRVKVMICFDPSIEKHDKKFLLIRQHVNFDPLMPPGFLTPEAENFKQLAPWPEESVCQVWRESVEEYQS
jgi:hypothetical protein